MMHQVPSFLGTTLSGSTEDWGWVAIGRTLQYGCSTLPWLGLLRWLQGEGGLILSLVLS